MCELVTRTACYNVAAMVSVRNSHQELLIPPWAGLEICISPRNIEYKVIEKIGEGSFSEVVKCQNRDTGGLFAAKRLKKTFQTVAEAVAIPEVIAMRKMSWHPNILYLLEQHFDEMPGKVTLIFELMDMSMYDLIKNRRRPPPETRVKSYMYQLLLGCHHLHHNGIFHRDIKPENILMKGDQVKLGDLGSIRGVYSRPPYTEYISTRWYRSPECLLTTGFYGPKMDVWACGCVFYELLTLKPLFPGENELDQISRIHNVLGTPHAVIAAKFRRHKSRNCETLFPVKCGIGLQSLLPCLTESGRDVMRHMLIYDPENRSNVRRLLDHRYFADLRELDIASGKSSMTSTTPSSSIASVDWRQAYSMGDRRRKAKRLGSNKRILEAGKSEVVASTRTGVLSCHRLPRQVISSPCQRRVLVRHRPDAQQQAEVDQKTSRSRLILPAASKTSRSRLILPAAGVGRGHGIAVRKSEERRSITNVRSSLTTNVNNASLDELQAAAAAAAAAVAAAAAAAATRPQCSRIPIRRGRSAITSSLLPSTTPRLCRSDATSFLPSILPRRTIAKAPGSSCELPPAHVPVVPVEECRSRLSTIHECPFLDRNDERRAMPAAATGILPAGLEEQLQDLSLSCTPEENVFRF